MHRYSKQSRDAALHKLGRINRWLIVGSVTLTGVLAEVAASAFAGRTLKSPARTSSTSGSRAKPSASAHTTTQALKPPASPPASESQQASGESAKQAPESSTQTPESSQAAPEASQSQAAPEASHESAPPAETSAPATSGGS